MDDSTKMEGTSTIQADKKDNDLDIEASSPSSNSSDSVGSSKSSNQDKRERKSSPPKRRESASKSPKDVRNRSTDKEKNRSRSRDHSDDSKRDRDRGRRSRDRNDRADFRPQGDYRGSNQRRDRRQDSSGSGSRSPDNRRSKYDNNGKKKTIIYKPPLDGPLWTFRQFMEAQRFDVNASKAEKVYQKYKSEHEEKQFGIFFVEHKDDEWFKEKYDPVLAEKVKEERRVESRASAERFFKSLKESEYQALNLNYEDYQHKSHFNETAQKGTGEIEEEKEQSNTKLLGNFTEVFLEANNDITGAPLFGFDPNSQTLFIRSVPKHVSRWDLTEALKKLAGFVFLSLSEPLKSQDFVRYGWVMFDSEDNCNKGFELVKTLNIKNYAFNIVNSRSQRKSVKICENVDKDRIQSDIELSKQLIEALDEEKDIPYNPLIKEAAQETPEQQLDMQILYLRKTHSYCLYCAAEYTDERMLAAKCGPIHLRRFKLEKSESVPDLPDWHRRSQELIKERVEESKKRQRRTLQEVEKKLEEEMDVLLKEKCEKHSAKHGNWPCKYCQKIFKESHFVLKHIKTKHQDKYDKLKETRIYENYVADKDKITNATGNYDNQQRNYGRHGHNQNQGNHRRGGYNNRGNQGRGRQNQPYRDLDDPKVVQTKVNRAVVDYGDL